MDFIRKLNHRSLLYVFNVLLYLNYGAWHTVGTKRGDKTQLLLKTKIMKTIFTLLLSTLISLTTFAEHNTRLTITSVGTDKLYAEVDGRRYVLDGTTLSLRGIEPGYHQIIVYRDRKKSNNRWWDFGKGANRRSEIFFDKRVYLKENYHFDVLVNRFGKVFIDEQRTEGKGVAYGYDEDERKPGRDQSTDRRDHRFDNQPERIMKENEFNDALAILRREWFENTRMSKARLMIDQNYFTSRQVKDICLLFTFENNRLELARYAYGKTVDRENYDLVNEVFSNNSNKKELAQYIRDYRE